MWAYGQVSSTEGNALESVRLPGAGVRGLRPPTPPTKGREAFGNRDIVPVHPLIKHR